MTDTTAPARLGVVGRVVTAAVVLAFGWATLGLAGVAIAASPLQPRSLVVRADFPQTVGLYPRSKVEVQGIVAGYVSSVSPRVDGVTVTMHLHGVSLAPDPVATIRMVSLIGERDVSLGPAWSGRGPRLTSGWTIPRSRTVVPAEISDVLDQLTGLAKGIDKQAAGRLVHELAQSVAGRHDAIGAAVTDFATAGKAVSGETAVIDASLAHLQGVIGTLAQHDGELADLMRNAGVVSDALLAQEGALDASITGIDGLLGQLAAFSKDQKEKLTDLLTTLGRVGTTLAAHDRDFATIVQQLPFFSYGYDRAIDHDGNSWYTINGPMGILFLPVGPPLNTPGGPGNYGTDHRVVPGIDHSQSPAAPLVPSTVNASPTGSGPLLPDLNAGPACVDQGCGK